MKHSSSRLPLAAYIGSVLIVFVLGCKREDPSVVLYASADEHVARQVMTAFQQDTGITVRIVGDTEVKKTTGLVDRIIAEADHPQADVFWSSEIFMTIDLAKRGLLEPHRTETTADWPAQWRDSEHRWHGFAARARVIVYSPQRVSPDQAPRTWMSLAATDAWRGRIAMADPRFGTTGGHLAAMKAYWDSQVMPGYYSAFVQGLAEQSIKILPSGNAGVVQAVISGEADIGLTDTDDVYAAREQGHELEMAYATHAQEGIGIGTLLIPNTVAVVRGSPRPELARRLADYLLSEKVERMLAESSSRNIPLRPELQSKYSALRPPNPLAVDYALAASLRVQAIEEFMNAVDHQAGDPPSPRGAQQPDSQPRQQPVLPLSQGPEP